MMGAIARKHRGRRAVGAVAVSALLLAACGTGDTDADNADGAATEDPGEDDTDGEEAEDDVYGGDFRMAVSNDASSLDPASGPAGSDYIILYPMYDTLIDFDPETLEPAPGLASDWEWTDDTTLRLTLEEGVLFHDGTEMDAEAVKASLEHFQDAEIHADINGVEEIEVVDDHTLDLHTGQPDAALVLDLADRAGMVVSPAALEEHGEDFDLNGVGTGPFQLEEWREGNAIVLSAFEDHWREGPPYVDSITMEVLPDRGAAMNAVRGGEIHFSDNLDAAQIDQIEGTDLVVTADDTMIVDMMYVNIGMDPLEDEQVRLAINHAIDREDILQAGAFGYGEVAWGPVPEGHWAYDPETENQWEHDPELAREILEEAGYEDGDIEVSAVFGTDTSFTRVNETIQAQLEEVGITYDLNPMDINQGVTRYFQDQAFDVAQFTWSHRPETHVTYDRLFSSESFQNPEGIAVEGIEEAMSEAVQVDDLDERAEAYARVNEIVAETAPWVPLYWQPNITAHSPEVRNYQPNLLGKPKMGTIQLDEG